MIEFEVDIAEPGQVPDVEREPLFSVPGPPETPGGPPTVREYSIPVEFSAGESLTYLTMYRKLGPDLAASWAMEYALGAEGYNVLCNLPKTPANDANFAKLIGIITGRMLGGNRGKAVRPEPKQRPVKRQTKKKVASRPAG